MSENMVPSYRQRKNYLLVCSKSFMRGIWVIIGLVFIVIGIPLTILSYGKIVPVGYVNGVPTGEFNEGLLFLFIFGGLGVFCILIGCFIAPLFVKLFSMMDKKYPVADVRISKAELLRMAEDINIENPKLSVEVFGDWIDVTANWQDALSMAPMGVNIDRSIFKKMILIQNGYTYRELDFEGYVSINTSMRALSYHKKFRCGKIVRKAIEYSIGVNNSTGNVGLNKYSLSTVEISDAIHKWLADRGYRCQD